ncbi:tRNA methyltransferase [Natrinema mahii]|nr:tRNA methyltransferase [Natrinema mahii]
MLLARIEVAPDELERAREREFVETVRAELSERGVDHVTLDLHGYRSGSVSPEETAGGETTATRND